MNDVSLAALVEERVKRAYGGRKAAFARAVGISPQSVGQLISGQTTLPTVEVRRRLSKELGISHVQILIMAGEIDQSELAEVGVEGVIDDGPKRVLTTAIDQFDWTDEKLRAAVGALRAIGAMGQGPSR